MSKIKYNILRCDETKSVICNDGKKRQTALLGKFPFAVKQFKTVSAAEKVGFQKCNDFTVIHIYNDTELDQYDQINDTLK